MSVINTNYLALVSQNNLTKSQNALGTAIERLSSGLRINSAKDDAAGQAIANRFTANIKGLTQAGRNANDGISIAQTTEGALNEINNNLQRIRELSVQAANGSNSQSDLDSIQAEITQRLDEINRVSEQTQFNSVRVLANADYELKVQVGANDHETITVKLDQINSQTLGLGNLNISNKSLDLSKVATAATTEARAAAPTEIPLSGSDANVAGAWEVYVSNTNADDLYVSRDGSNFYAVTGYDNGTGSLEFSSASAASATSADVTAVAAGQQISVGGGVTVNADDVSPTDQNPDAPVETFYIGTGGADDFYVSLDGGNTFHEATFDASTGVLSYDSSASAATHASGSAPVAGVSEVLNTNEIPGSAVAVNMDGLSSELVGATPTLHAVEGGGYVIKGTSNGTDVYYQARVADDGTVSIAQDDKGKNIQLNPDPLAAIDAALQKVDNLRSDLGAIQNRFQSTIANLANTVNNLSAARSRIEDADYAVEVSNMTRAQILQQAGTSVLAQANQVPQTVLSLLR